MTNNTPRGAKSITKVPNQKVARQPTCFSFFFFFFFFFWCFSQKTAAFFTEQCTSPSLFFQVRSYIGRFEPLTEELWLPSRHHVFFTCLHVHKSPSNEMSLFHNIAELEILLVWFFSQYCIGSLWGETCCSIIDGKLQLKHASAAKKKWHEQE